MSEQEKCICGQFPPVTEAAALAAAEWIGRGDAVAGTVAARGAMAEALAKVPFLARVVAGRPGSEKSDPLRLGTVTGAFANGLTNEGASLQEETEVWDLAVRALEGRNALAKGLDGAVAMIAAGPKGHLAVVPEMYMQKIVVGNEAAGMIDIDAPVGDNIKAVATALGRSPSDLTVVVLDRPRHEDLIEEIKRAGPRLKLIDDGDVSAGIAAVVQDTGIDMCIGIGGSTGGIITAAALRSLGGAIQTRFWPVSRHQVETLKNLGITDIEAKLDAYDLAGEGVLMAATSITRGRFLRGVERCSDGVRTDTMVMCSRCQQIRLIRTIHRVAGTKSPIKLWMV